MLMSRTPAICFGTRPELIKLAPVIKQLEAENIDHQIIYVKQHTGLLEPFLELFDIKPTASLTLHAGSLPARFGEIMESLQFHIWQKFPDLCPVVQGDTLTVAATSLWAFYQQSPLVHVEAGLRSDNLMHPWPEEMHRRLTTLCATHNCAPTHGAWQRLNKEQPSAFNHITGNTVVDAVELVDIAEHNHPLEDYILCTGHRRENDGQGIADVMRGVYNFLQRRPEAVAVWVTHPNNSYHAALAALKHVADAETLKRFQFIEPVDYPTFLGLMKHARLIVSDSGGVQEEATAVETHVLVTRKTTERPEAVTAGYATLVDTEPAILGHVITEAYDNPRIPGVQTRPFDGPNGTPSKDVVGVIKEACKF
jgi:UDP-N-acetylglucosamine 2-epimerase (non-hydrolysing)